MTSTPDSTVCEFQVAGITCMDCALKFEREVQQLPGVISARLNATSGLLQIEGECGLDAIRRLGRIEKYEIVPRNLASGAGSAADPGSSPHRRSAVADERIRTVLALLAVLLGYALPMVGYSVQASAVAFLVATGIGGWSNFRKAALSILRLDFNMSVLMSVAVIGAVILGEYEEAGIVALLFSVSELLEGWTHDRARRSIADLMDIAPKIARVQRAGVVEEISVDNIRVGDVVLVKPGEKIPVDGIIDEGSSSVTQSAITGESVPAELSHGDPVYAGSLNGHGALRIVTERLVADTVIAHIVHLVEEAQASKTPSQQFVERFARVYTPAVIVLAAGLAVLPPLVAGLSWSDWVYRALALLVVSCPCALVVSTPVATVSAIATAARRGVLIKGGVHLEQLAAVRAIAFDKTGTLTRGEPAVIAISVFEGSTTAAGHKTTADEVLRVAAAIEQHSEHPIARAVMKESALREITIPHSSDFQAEVGTGARATLDGQVSRIGSARSSGSLDQAQAAEVERLESMGATALVVVHQGEPLGAIAVADTVRSEAASTLQQLRTAGIGHIAMLTGDSERVASKIAAETGVDIVEHSLMPSEKLDKVAGLLGQYGSVAMVGDGINDAPAMAASSVGIAMGGMGSDTALETADIVLMGDEISRLPFAVSLSRATMRVIHQNVAFSIGIKALALLAVYPGWLTLWLAILADMGATLLVTLNGLRLLTHRKGL